MRNAKQKREAKNAKRKREAKTRSEKPIKRIFQ